jgi:hypothetical protein
MIPFPKQSEAGTPIDPLLVMSRPRSGILEHSSAGEGSTLCSLGVVLEQEKRVAEIVKRLEELLAGKE